MKDRSRKGIKATISAFAASLLVGAFSSAAMAQSTNLVDKFDNGYLNTHPDVATALSNDPSLVDNKQWPDPIVLKITNVKAGSY